MINYHNFQFACPPETGGEWFYKSLRLAGVEYTKVDNGGIFVTFPEDRTEEVLRVSLVRHPCDWLTSIYKRLKTMQLFYLPKRMDSFSKLPTDTLENFTFTYLQTMPGEIGRLYSYYRADSYMRIEDMPWAMVEFLEMIGIKRPEKFPDVVGKYSDLTLNDDLWGQVLKAEEETCDAYDYY